MLEIPSRTVFVAWQHFLTVPTYRALAVWSLLGCTGDPLAHVGGVWSIFGWLLWAELDLIGLSVWRTLVALLFVIIVATTYISRRDGHSKLFVLSLKINSVLHDYSIYIWHYKQYVHIFNITVVIACYSWYDVQINHHSSNHVTSSVMASNTSKITSNHKGKLYHLLRKLTVWRLTVSDENLSDQELTSKDRSSRGRGTEFVCFRQLD